MNTIKLNPKQQECIDNLEGKYLVIAGPGTGKTFTVTQRIKAILDKGVNPEKILCLTFSETAASEMKNKLIQTLNSSNADVNIYTFHGFCNDILGQFSESFELPENYKIITDPVKNQLIKECIDEYNPKYYRNSKNNPYVYLNIIIKKISEIKKYRYTKEQYFENIEKNPSWNPKKNEIIKQIEELKNNPNTKPDKIEKLKSSLEEQEETINKAIEIWNCYELYKSKMEKEGYIDFDDMITYVIEKFDKSPAFLDKISKKYDYIMVDEYQDTNEAQNSIVFFLASNCKNIFVVGDDDQIIYSFQGANLDTIQNFLEKFPDTKVICLKENMRSTQSILDVAREISKQDGRRLEINPKFLKYNINKDLIAKNKNIIQKDKKVRCTIYNNTEQEYLDIVDEIKNLIDSNDCPKNEKGEKNLSQIAVISTSNEQLQIFADKFKDKNIPTELKEGKSIFEINSSITLLYYLQMLANPELYSDKIFKLLLLEPFKINPIDYGKIYEKISINKTFIESMRTIDNWIEKEKINNFLKTYDELREYISAESPRNVVVETGYKTGIFKYYLEEKINKNENIEGLKKLIEEASNFSENPNNNFYDFIDYLLIIQNDKDLDIKTNKPITNMNAVQLTTYHSSKGKEYEYVYMPTLQARRWESSSSSFKPTIPTALDKYKTDEQWQEYKISDKIKTMYVGMTRAKHALRLSYAISSGKRNSPASKWITNAQHLMEIVYKNEINENTENEINSNILIKRPYDYKRDFKILINTKMQNRAYSQTLFNTYQECPRKFLYSEILNFDTRLSISDSANYGSAIHKTFEYIIKNAIKTKQYPKKEEVLDIFRNIFSTFPMSNTEIKEMYLQRGVNELNNYYQHLFDTPISNLYATEYKIEYETENYKFKGIIDKLEKNPDGTFNIIDYKTSKPESEKAISYNGKYKNYYNQMCLYKYFFEKITGNKVKETNFLFLLDGKTRVLNLTEEECKQVIYDFEQTLENIKNCNFEPNYEESGCTYCPYKDFCRMDIV